MVNIQKLKEKKNIDALINLLSHKKEKIREEAAEALGVVGCEATNSLISVLAERLNSKNSRIYAAKALGFIPDPYAPPALVKGLQEEEEVANSCAQSLIRHGFMSVPHLTELITQNSPQMAHVVYILGEIKDTSTVPTLLYLLANPDPVIRKETIIALGKIGDPSAIRWLVGLLSDSDSGIREAAAMALAQLKAVDALPYLEHLLFDQEEGVRNASKGAIDFITQLL